MAQNCFAVSFTASTELQTKNDLCSLLPEKSVTRSAVFALLENIRRYTGEKIGLKN
jgi:hypothetical protein